MTVLKGYSTLEEAHLGRSLLASEGIDAQVLDENMSMAPHLLLASGVRLAVADEDAAAAREILGFPAAAPRVPRRGINPLWMIGIMAVAVFTVFYFGVRQRSNPDEAPNTFDQDRNRDGKTDVKFYFDGEGLVMSAQIDDNFDGRWDGKETYESGIVVETIIDRNFDGLFDSTFSYVNGVAASETIRPGGQGFPLFRHDLRQGVLAVTWSDKDRDGKWDERIDYDPMGRETRREALD